MTPSRIHIVIIAASVALTSAAPTMAQTGRPPITVRVHVADSSGTPVAGAEVSVIRGLADVSSHGLTDARGLQTLTIQSSGKDAELVVRKLGYLRVNRFFVDTAAPPAIDITLARSVRALDTVKVAEREDPTHKSYFIDADAIENSPRLVVDALDVVMKLRPDMIWSRAGTPDRIAHHVTATGRVMRRSQKAPPPSSPVSDPNVAQSFGDCGAPGNPPVANIWVNGMRIRDVPINPVDSLKRFGAGLALSPTIATVLGSIKPEHIAEMQYHSCAEAVPDSPPHSQNAIMVQLKDGIGYESGFGSYVIGSLPSSRASLVAARILGVFDDDGGAPLVDVDVVDVATGTIARTTETGTVSLVFLPAGESQLRIQRAGYAAQIFSVTMSPRDTLPITVVLARAKAPLAREH